MGENLVFAFSDQGRRYDAEGRLRDWWTPADAARFEAEAQKLSVQYSAIEPIPGVHVNGVLVREEAVADLGGLLIALDAYHLSLHGRTPPRLDGFTGDQRFFLGRAQMWRAKVPLEFARNQLATGFNAPPFVRVNGPVRNMDAWYDAFDVRPGDKLYLAPGERVRLW